MGLNKDYNEEADDDDWDMVPDGEIQGEEEALPPPPPAEDGQPEPLMVATAPPAEEDETNHDTINTEKKKQASRDDDAYDTAQEEEIQVKGTVENITPTKEEAIHNKVEDTSEHDSTKEEVAKEETKDIPADCPQVEKETATKETTPLQPNNVSRDNNDTNTNNTSNTSNNNNRKKPRAASLWLGSSLKTIGSALQGIEQKHNIKQKARHSIHTVGVSMRQVGVTVDQETKGLRVVVGQESQRAVQRVQEWDIEAKAKNAANVVETRAKAAADVVDHKAKQLGDSIQHGAKTAGASIQNGAKKVGDKAQQLHKDGKVADFLTAAAVVGAGVLLVKGKPGASGAVLATSGAVYMAGQAQRSSYQQDTRLNEELHME